MKGLVLIRPKKIDKNKDKIDKNADAISKIKGILKEDMWDD